MNRRLYRSTEHKILGGVCGGLGEHFNIDPTWVRLAFVVLAITHGLGILLYLIGWVIIPKQPAGEKAATSPSASPPPTSSKSTTAQSLLPGLILIGLGILFLLHESFWWFDFQIVWPVILILVGGALIYRSLEARRVRKEEQETANESR